MLPSQSRPTAKRKQAEDFTSLTNNSKRSKIEPKASASNKRKLLNAEEQPGGLLIVRAPTSSRPPSSQGQAPASQPNPSTTSFQISQPSRSQSQRPPASTSPSGAGPSGLKKFRAGSQPPPSSAKPPRSKGQGQAALTTTHDDLELDQEIQAMEDEADRIRRNSRAPTTFDSSDFQFPPRTETSQKGKPRFRDTSEPITMTESPQIERNKLMREGAMNLNKSGQPPASERTGRDRTREAHGHQRRKSSISSRGKRISSSFENTGVIAQPHPSVPETSFYKHIDCDLPDVERIRQLLIWCTSRAATTYATPRPPDSTSPPKPPLPPLSAKGTEVLKNVQEKVVKMLAMKQIDISPYGSHEAASGSTKPVVLKENEQNVCNRKWEVTYTTHIESAQREEEAWKKVIFIYEAYKKKTLAEQVKRAEQHRSAVAKGKQRATGEEWLVREHDLPQDMQRSAALAKAVISSYQSPGAGGSTRSGIGVLEEGLHLDRTLDEEIGDLEFTLDQLHTFANAARTTTNISERFLDQQFALLSTTLRARTYPPPPISGDKEAREERAGVRVLNTYLRPPRGPANARDVLCALARVDYERPPTMIGDAARRAAREVQRIGDVGDRKLTGIPTMSQTPRKMPGTPRRGTTPGKDRER